jgi:hypothetical protein
MSIMWFAHGPFMEAACQASLAASRMGRTVAGSITAVQVVGHHDTWGDGMSHARSAHTPWVSSSVG